MRKALGWGMATYFILTFAKDGTLARLIDSFAKGAKDLTRARIFRRGI